MHFKMFNLATLICYGNVGPPCKNLLAIPAPDSAPLDLWRQAFTPLLRCIKKKLEYIHCSLYNIGIRTEKKCLHFTRVAIHSTRITDDKFLLDVFVRNAFILFPGRFDELATFVRSTVPCAPILSMRVSQSHEKSMPPLCDKQRYTYIYTPSRILRLNREKVYVPG